MQMTKQRYAEADKSGTLTPQETAQGWHFCPCFDGMLTQGQGSDIGTCVCGNPIPLGADDSLADDPKDGAA